MVYSLRVKLAEMFPAGTLVVVVNSRRYNTCSEVKCTYLGPCGEILLDLRAASEKLPPLSTGKGLSEFIRRGFFYDSDG